MLEAYIRHPEAFTSTVQERTALPLEWWQKRLDARADANELVLAATDGDRMMGVAGLSFETRTRARHKATLFGMYVADDFRHRGIGQALVRASLEHARSRAGVRLVQLTVTQGNDAARSLYERCGFVAFGVEPLAIAVGEDFLGKVHMWCGLRGEAG
jgi:ribosomal protein S18 acetylase RimI-like enzyme